MIRMLAWWGTTRAMSSVVTPAWAIDFWAESTMIRTARRKTSLPSICMRAADLGVEEALGAAVGVEVPAQQLAAAVDGFEHDGARAVGEQDGRVAVLPVGDAGRVSVPMTRIFSAPMAIRPWATTSAYVKPEQAALTSNAPQRRPSSCGDGRRAWPAPCGRVWWWPARWRRSRRGRAPTSRSPGGRTRPRARPWCRRRGARGSRCARRSTRRSCRAHLLRGPGW